MPSDDAEWIDLLCFRDGHLSDEDHQLLKQSGLSYVFSASGLHVYVLTAIVFGALTLLRLPRSASILICLLILTLYCMASGLHMSTIRASLSCVLFLSAYLVRREPDTLSALALAAIGYLLFDPFDLFTIGFQMTAIIVAGLALFMPRLITDEMTAVGLILKSAKAIVVAATIILLAGQPIVAYYFQELSLSTIPANLLTAVVAPVAIGLCFVAYPMSKISLTLGAGFLGIAGPLVDFLRVVVVWSTGWRPIGIPEFSAWWLVLYYGLWLSVWRPRAVPV
jgi:competence protein ComEC